MESEERTRMRGSQFKGSDFGASTGKDQREFRQTWTDTKDTGKKTEQQKWEEEYQKSWD